MEMVGVPLGALVLDVACGAGAAMLVAAEQAGPNGLVVGVDRASAMLDRARDAIRERGLFNAHLARLDANALAIRDRTFDRVLCNFALDALPSSALRELARVLRAGGRVGLTVSESWWWEDDERWDWHRQLLQTLGVRVNLEQRRFPTTTELAAVLTDYGFTGVTAITEEYPLLFADVGEWWSWAWSHGYRAILERMSPAELERYRAACFDQLRERPVQGRLQVFLTAATKSDP